MITVSIIVSNESGTTTSEYDYQTWMLTEVQDLQKAVMDKISTEHL